MSRKVVIDGNGVIVSQGATLIGNITELTLPGWTLAPIDDTALDNTDVTTYVPSNLRDYSDLSFTVKAGAETAISAGVTPWTIKMPTGATFGFYGFVTSRGDISFANGSAVLIPLTVKLANVSGGAIVAPTFTSGGIVTSGGALVQ